ncbi:alpha/beta hydrolase [Rhodococcus sp. D2-41]|uniref:alpha/beta hydrolase n=1 Tax=Speluncibacter jeojiensis TaxID=2710754 RepID=UPI00240FF62E|nr:alpha/beta hydrolase [Rhodococcus sp. D2-41]MDG3012513.1 alpha/beta hydrolase [Rhodococcus sp. D2-41]
MTGGRGRRRAQPGPIHFHRSTSAQSRAMRTAARAVLKPVFRLWPLTPGGVGTLRHIDSLATAVWRPEGCDYRKTTLRGIPAEVVTSHRRPTLPLEDTTVLYFHGGAFVLGGIGTHRGACALLAERSGATVISAEYTQVPNGSVADSVRDAMTAYERVLDTCPDPTRVVVAGDSAGGYLSVKVAELATERGLQQPLAVLGFSPQLSLFPDQDPEKWARATRQRDAYLPLRRITRLRPFWLPAGSTLEGNVSVLDAVGQVYAPVFFTACDDEALYPDIEDMTERLAAAGRTVETHVWSGQIHAFPAFGAALPEAREAIMLAVDFVRGILRDARSGREAG